MNEENDRRTRLLEDLDNVRKRISELEKSEKEHFLAESDLRDNMDRYYHAVDALPVGVFTIDVQGKIDYINSFLVKIFDLKSAQEAKEIEVEKFPLLAETGVADKIRNCLESRKQGIYEFILKNQSGKGAWFRQFLNPLYNRDGSINGVMGVVFDITEQKSDHDEISEKLIWEKSMNQVLIGLVGTFEVDDALNVTLTQIGRLSGAARTFLFLLYENDTMMDNTHEWCAEGVEPLIDSLQNLKVNEYPWLMGQLSESEVVHIEDPSTVPEVGEAEGVFLEKLGGQSYVLVPVHIKDKFAGMIGLSSISQPKNWKGRDIQLLQTVETMIGEFLERKRLDDIRRERDERFRRMAQASFEGIFILEKGYVTDSNHVAVALLGHKPSEIIGKNIVDFISQNDQERIKQFIESGASHVEEALAVRKDGISIQVEIQNKTIPAQNTVFQVASIRDISGRAPAEKPETQDIETVKVALDGVAEALAAAVSIRDPFAAGHEQGVARLAGMIAEKLGLPENQREGIRIASIVHDLGKVAIPSEILSKPADLSDAEYMLVKEHPVIGYEILKDIAFPWPVAKIVLQHHERLNGSGYPNGLKAAEICQEARIIAVADTVEAILSGRSWRPALGLESAIRELTNNKGKLFDEEIVDVTLDIISAEGFSTIE